jgi:GntR family transcriptional regulator/MocR family aminotransferase
LSKTLAPGLRIGYMVGPRDLIKEARALRRLMVRHPPGNNQRTLALFVSSGYHDSLIRRMSHAYKDRWQVLGTMLAEHLPQSAQIPTFGGTSYWVQGPAELDARELMRRAHEQSILLEPGDVHFISDDPPLNYFRLGFSSITSDKIRPGIEKLATLVRALS